LLKWVEKLCFQGRSQARIINSMNFPEPQRWRLSVAPMMDWTDRHCRFFHRLLTRHTLLYTEMVTTGALRHGNVQRHLRLNAEEHPVALQLGGQAGSRVGLRRDQPQLWLPQ
jgi:tRNA-dihydrouridine synthase A